MIRIHVTAAAYEAIADSLAGRNALLPAQRSSQGGFFLWLTKTTVNQLMALRGRGEDISDVICRLAEMETVEA